MASMKNIGSPSIFRKSTQLFLAPEFEHLTSCAVVPLERKPLLTSRERERDSERERGAPPTQMRYEIVLERVESRKRPQRLKVICNRLYRRNISQNSISLTIEVEAFFDLLVSIGHFCPHLKRKYLSNEING